MKKSLLLVLLLVVAPLVLNAQTKTSSTGRGMQRLEFQISSETKPAVDPKSAKPLAQSFELILHETDVTIAGNPFMDSTLPIHASLKNITSEPLYLGFRRKQTLPALWRSSVCFGTNCFAPEVNERIDSIYPWEPGESRELILDLTTPSSATDSGEIALTVFSPEFGDSIHVTFKARMLPLEPIPCRVVKIANPYLNRVKVNAVSISNTDAYDMEVKTDLKYKVLVGDGVHVQLCHKNFDSQNYTTDVIFQTDSGTFTQTITLLAPSSNSVQPVSIVSGVKLLGVAPNPASASNGLTVSIESNEHRNVSIVVADLLGRELSQSATSLQSGLNQPKLDLGQLPAGSYVLLVRDGGSILAQSSFNVTK